MAVRNTEKHGQLTLLTLLFEAVSDWPAAKIWRGAMQNSTLDKKPTNALLSHHPMNKPNHLPAVVPASGGALTTTPGTQRIATRMADDLLNVARSRERALASQRRYRIGEYEFREADHDQIQRWARMLGIGPEAVVEGLAKMQKKARYSFLAKEHVDFRVQDGSIVSLAWNFDTFPLADWAWVDGLKIERMGILNPQNGRLPTLPRSLRGLFCEECKLTTLDLTPVPGLTELSCDYNQLTDLDLTPAPGLTYLYCGDNQLTDLDLTPMPGLTELSCDYNQLTHIDLTPVPGLTTLRCWCNRLTRLDLTPVPGLTELSCDYNQLTHIDLTPVPRLTELRCWRNRLTRLDLTPVPGLTKLNCGCNRLADLDLTPVPGLKYLQCDKNLRLTNAPRNLEVTRS